MSKILPISIVVLILLFSFTTHAIATPENVGSTTNQTSTAFTHADAINITNALVYGALGSITGIFITPILRELFKKRQAYFKPYIKWCVSFAGILHEFEEICGDFRKETPSTHLIGKPYTQTDILSHLWQMHHEVEDGIKWLIMMKKDDQKAGEALDEIMNGVDRLWHNLENNYAPLLNKATNHKDFQKIVKDMKKRNPQMVNKIAMVIRTDIRIHHREFAYHLFEEVECYLYKKTPKRFWQIRIPSCSQLFPLSGCLYCHETQDIRYLTSCLKCGRNTCERCRKEKVYDEYHKKIQPYEYRKEICSLECLREFDEYYSKKSKRAQWRMRRKLQMIEMKRRIGSKIHWLFH